MSTEHRCPRCGTVMIQQGAEAGKAIFSCRSCGFKDYVDLTSSDNSDYLAKRAALLGRIRTGIFDWEATSWDNIRKDIVDFTTRYDAARADITFKVATIACLTDGFHNMNSEKYKECKQIFKISEKVYKRYTKDPSSYSIPQVDTTATMMEYEEYRALFKKCRYDFRQKKFLWKIAFFFFKKLIPKPF